MKNKGSIMLKKFCDVSNYSRMRMPKGKKNYQGGQQLAEEMLQLIMKRQGGVDDTAQVLSALGQLKAYFGNAVDRNYELSADELISRYEKLYRGDAWMGLHEDLVQFEVDDFVAGKPRWHQEIGRIRKK